MSNGASSDGSAGLPDAEEEGAPLVQDIGERGEPARTQRVQPGDAGYMHTGMTYDRFHWSFRARAVAVSKHVVHGEVHLPRTLTKRQ